MVRTLSAGGGLGGTVDVPGVGGVPKVAVAAVGVAAVGVVAYMYLRPAPPVGEDGVTDGAGSEFGEDGTPPGVIGAVRPGNDYGLADDTPSVQPSVDSYGFTGTTNDQWSQYVAGQLGQSGRWDLGDIFEALGNFLSGRPLTTLQQQIVSAGIGAGGRPPVGNPVLIPGGDAGIRVAPSITRVTTTPTAATVSHTLVAGASSYQVFRSGSSSPVGSGTTGQVTVSGLEPGHTYTFRVRALSASGAAGPTSTGKSARTGAVKLATPGRPRVSSITRTSAHVSVPAVAGAELYMWFVDGTGIGKTENPARTITGLKPGSRHTVAVAADTAGGSAGKRSTPATFRTKK